MTVINDKQTFQRTLKSFDQGETKSQNNGEGLLTNIKEKKQDLIIKIRDELESIEHNMENTSDSNYKSTLNVESRETSIEADESLPTWLQLFIERSDSLEANAKRLAEEKNHVEVPPEIETNEPHIDVVNKNLNEELHNDGDKMMTPDFSNIKESIYSNEDNCSLKSKISKLKNIFNFQHITDSGTNPKVPKYVTTCDIKEKFEKSGKSESNTGLGKAPSRKLIEINKPETCQPKVENKEQKKWKWKENKNKDVDDVSDLLEDCAVDDFGDDELNKERSFHEKETVEKLLSLIDDSSQPVKREVKPSRAENKIGQLDGSKMQDLFMDQRSGSKPSRMVSKLSKSLTFLNKTEFSSKSSEKSNEKLRHPFTMCTAAKKEAIENKFEAPVSLEVMRNRVQKKIIESPWVQIQENKNSEDLQKKEIKYWKPKIKEEQPLIFAGFQQFQPLEQTRLCKSSNISDSEALVQRPQIRCAEVNDHDEDLEDILNYEDSAEIKEYEDELRARYDLDYNNSSDEESVERNTSLKPADSFSSLMNILTTMRKSRLSKSVSACKLNLIRSSENQKPMNSQHFDLDFPSLNNEERKANYERTASCKNSNVNLKNIYNEELEEVRLHRQKVCKILS